MNVSTMQEMRRMKIRVTRDDIRGGSGPVVGGYASGAYSSGRTGIDNPITRAIRRVTGQTWVIFGGNTAYYRTCPYRTLSLPYEVHQQWQIYQKTGVWHPFEFEIDMEFTVQKPRTPIGDRRRRERRKAARFAWDRRHGDRRGDQRRDHDRRVGPRR
ncbi:MAG TPA: hypothetical protein VF719_12140 [Abditibacteriaceae bacterium]